MATLSSIVIRRDNATRRIERALGVRLPVKKNNVPHPAEYNHAAALEAVADYLECRHPDDPPHVVAPDGGIVLRDPSSAIRPELAPPGGSVNHTDPVETAVGSERQEATL